MKLKKEYLILLLIIAVLTVYLAMRSKDQTHYTLPQPAQTDSQKINRLVITKGDRSIELSKKDEQWTVGPKAYPADAIKVKNMVKAAADLAITDLISESGNYDRYDLTDSRKINIQAFAGNEQVRNFDVGKGAPTNQHTFTRLGNDPKVYQARGSLNKTFDHTLAELRDLTVLSFEKGDITSLVVQKGAQSLSLTKKEVIPEKEAQPAEPKKQAEQKEADTRPQPQWQDPEGEPVDQAAVDRLLNDLSNFKCSQFLEDEAATDLKAKTPIWNLMFISDKATYSLSVLEKATTEDEEFPGLSSAQPYAFTIAKSKAEAIQKQMEKLLNGTSKAE